MLNRIGIVVPSVREESLKRFIKEWEHLFKKHDVVLVVVKDGDKPFIEYKNYGIDNDSKLMKIEPKYPKKVMDLIYNKSDVVRNLGFYFLASEFPTVDTFITLDDDCYPNGGDPIRDHCRALEGKVPVSWFSIASEYMRGFPYGVREEAEVVLSHGIWENVMDWDAPTQLVLGNRKVKFYKGPIPKGVFYTMCGMNIAFKKKLLPYMYFAPMGHLVNMDRFGDIWLGVESKKAIDANGWAVVTGYATIWHDRASNVWKNLQKEAVGLELNEDFFKGTNEHPYFKLYKEKREQWKKLIEELPQ